MKSPILTSLFFAAFSLGCSSQSADNTSSTQSDDQAAKLEWITDASAKQLVIDYARAGQPALVYTDECYAGQVQLGGSDYCMEPVRLPAPVLKSVLKMNEQRFDNVSDYDQRITKLYAFKHDKFGTFSDKDEAASIADALSIPADMIAAMTENLYGGQDRSFLDILTGLTIDEDYQNKTVLHTFVSELLKDRKAKVFTFGPDEISLYPGGGFGISFMLIITDDHMIYIKNEGWNS